MTFLERLDNRIVERIVNVVCFQTTNISGRLSAYKELVVLASVSRQWHALVLPHMQSVLILEYQTSPASSLQLLKSPKSRRRAAWKSPGSTQKTEAALAKEHVWKTNVGLLQILGKQTPISKMRLQCFDCIPDFSHFVAAMDAAGLARCALDSVTTIEIMDQLDLAVAIKSSASSSGSSVSENGTNSKRHANASHAAAVYLAQHLPRVQRITSLSWNISLQSQHLVTHLAQLYFEQLHVLTVPLAVPVGTQFKVANNLTKLYIDANVLLQLGNNVIAAQQLQVLKLHNVDAFFSWETFASNTSSSSIKNNELEFTHLAALSIKFSSDNVVTTTDFYSSLGGSKYNVRVSMGRDRRRLLFPRLQSLNICKLPYTYTDAWRMFVDSPLKRLAVAGPYAHVRYIDPRLLRSLDVLDIHTVGADKHSGRFTNFVKSLLDEKSPVKSAWLRHAELFPLSVSGQVEWSHLTELCISAYMPTLAVLSLASQLPSLLRLTVQRIAHDTCEEELDQPFINSVNWETFVSTPNQPSSLSIRELQLHMGGEGSVPRIPTLQAICYILLCIPNVRLLAIKQMYCKYVCEFTKHWSKAHPQLSNIKLVRHVFMSAKSPSVFLE
ncbi:hypothetical protein IWW36_001413 [Coemansia brasiliensis]|uniref:Uncharacterized protein n=1 Tax=Coemansia brasiliensis TaxID=2650707 RepID=A0A9W8I9P4_9FUNG|nr:hypothetical protein IWW36_001413 [Coemansia brasiliensis]